MHLSKMRSRVPFFVLIAVAFPVSCSLFTSLDGLAGGGGTGALDGANDGPHDVMDESARDGGFCGSQDAHFLCADFDEGDAFGCIGSSCWTGTDPAFDGGGTLSLDPTVSPPSPPDALQVHLFADDAGPNFYPRLAVLFPTVPAAIHVVFDLSFCAAQFVGSGRIQLLKLWDQAGVGIPLDVDTGGPLVDPLGGGAAIRSVRAFTPFVDDAGSANWNHVTFDVVLSPTSGSVTMTIDGAIVLTAQDVATSETTTQTMSLRFGLEGYPPSPDCIARFDNVSVDFTP